jgi:hypothetical protein
MPVPVVGKVNSPDELAGGGWFTAGCAFLKNQFDCITSVPGATPWSVVKATGARSPPASESNMIFVPPAPSEVKLR